MTPRDDLRALAEKLLDEFEAEEYDDPPPDVTITGGQLVSFVACVRALHDMLAAAQETPQEPAPQEAAA